MGRRVGKMKNGVLLKQWIYRDALKPVTELDGAGNWVSQFVYGSTTGAPDYVRRGNQTYRVVTDHLGSPKYVVNVANAGDAPFSVSYTSFGQVSGTGLDWMPFGFTGGIFDADTGLLRLGARDYDPVLGRWVNKDPVRFESGQVNHYVYVANDPLNAIDPEGKDRVSCGATMVGCVVVCAGAAAASPTPIIILGGAACIACLVAVPSACEPEKPKPPPCDPSVSCCR
jgi:RHS repeat-associated protein